MSSAPPPRPAAVAHHAPADLLVEYAAGVTGEAEALLVATHLTLCAACRSEVALLEDVGGGLLGTAPRDGDVRPPELSELTTPRADGHEARQARAPRYSDEGVLPRPLLDYTGPLSAVRWRTALNGAIAYVDLPLSHHGVPVRLKRIAAGIRIPRHGHRGREMELVLSGGASDVESGARFGRGDVAVRDERHVHRVTIDADGECLVLGVQTGPLVPAGLWSRALLGWLGWSR